MSLREQTIKWIGDNQDALKVFEAMLGKLKADKSYVLTDSMVSQFEGLPDLSRDRIFNALLFLCGDKVRLLDMDFAYFPKGDDRPRKIPRADVVKALIELGEALDIPSDASPFSRGRANIKDEDYSDIYIMDPKTGEAIDNFLTELFIRFIPTPGFIKILRQEHGKQTRS